MPCPRAWSMTEVMSLLIDIKAMLGLSILILSMLLLVQILTFAFGGKS